MSSSYRLVINIFATYARSIISLALGLFSSRWILSTLGESDFGLFGLLGSIILFITFLNTIMASSAARYFAYSIGEGKIDEVRKWFNSALSVHVCFAIILITIGWPIGEYVISHVLTIAEGRMNAALWVFRISLASGFINMISVPFVGMFTAKQRITEMTIYGIVQTQLLFMLAYFLNQIAGDHLIIYAIGMSGIVIFIQLIIIFRASTLFSECQLVFNNWFDYKRISQIATYAVWSLIGTLGSTLRDQGTALLLNLYFGTKVNAAYGISNQVSAATNQLSAAMMSAISPEITTSEGQGDRKRMLLLAERANKFGTILVILFAIPLLIEMDYVLSIWLKTPPLHTALFCKLILAMFLIDRLTNGYMLAIQAHGKIAAYQATVGGFQVLTLPLAWLFIKLGHPPTSVGIASIITMVFCTCGRVLWMKHLLDVSVGSWFRKTLFPCITITIISSLVGLLCHQFISNPFLRLIQVGILTFMTSSLISWQFALPIEEQTFFKENSERLWAKMRSLIAANT